MKIAKATRKHVRPYTKHRLYELKNALTVLGKRALDQLTAVAKALIHLVERRGRGLSQGWGRQRPGTSRDYVLVMSEERNGGCNDC